jgi:hypothetical protein
MLILLYRQLLIVAKTSVSLKLQTLLQVGVSLFMRDFVLPVIPKGASSATVSNQVLFMFINCFNTSNQDSIHEDLKLCLDNASIHMSVIKRANQTGKKCRKQAAWIGLER